LHKVGDLLKVKKDGLLFIHLKYETFDIRQKDIDDFLINVRSLRKDKLDNIFKR